MNAVSPSLSCLSHDSAGFLQGPRLERWELGILGRTLPPIASDVRAIAQHVQRQVDILRQGRPTAAQQPSVYSPRSADVREKTRPFVIHSAHIIAANKDTPRSQPFVAQPVSANNRTLPHPYVTRTKPVAPVVVAQNTVASKNAVLTHTPVTPTVTPNTGRDARGRFTGSGAAATPHWRTPEHLNLAGTVSPLLERLGTLLRDSSHDISQTDPAVQAMQEVAMPLARTAQLFNLGGQSREEKRKTRWYRRIWQTLMHSQGNDARFHKSAHQHLKAIEEKPLAESGVFNGLLARWLSGLAGLLAPLGKLTALTGGAGALGSRLLGPIGKGLRPMGRMAGRIGRRIPVLGSLLGLGMSAWQSSAIEGDHALSRDEKNARHGKTWGSAGGGLAGALAGGAAGAALGSIVPGVGNVVGGVLGEWLG